MTGVKNVNVKYLKPQEAENMLDSCSLSENSMSAIQLLQNIIQYWSMDEKAIVLHLAFIINGHPSAVICGLTS